MKFKDIFFEKVKKKIKLLSAAVLIGILRVNFFICCYVKDIALRCAYIILEVLDDYIPASILYKSTAGRYRPVSYPDGPITARY